MSAEEETGRLTVFVTLEVVPDKAEEFLAGLRANAEATRAEPGCLHFDIHRSADNPHRYHLYEIYSDDDAFFIGHREAAHYPVWKSIVAECVVEGSHINTYARPV